MHSAQLSVHPGHSAPLRISDHSAPCACHRYSQLVAADSDTPTLLASLKNEVLSWVRSDTPSTYRADLFNTVDMVSLHLLLFSYIAYYAARAAYLPLRAFAVLALTIRLRALDSTATLGTRRRHRTGRRVAAPPAPP